jgi:hypothetical protein
MPAESIARFVDENFSRETEFLAALVKVPSDNPPGDCDPIAKAAQKLLEGLGLTVERHEVPRDTVAAAGMIAATNLIVRHRFGDGPVIALNAHGDVVPPGLGWSRDPYGAEIVATEHGPAMYGRGVAVSKSDFATYTFALLALIDAASKGVKLAGSVELHFTFDEEAGGDIGPYWLLAQGLSKPDYAISAGFSYAVVTAHNGCLHLEVEVTGKQAHAAMPSTGHDALEAATGILTALYDSRARLSQRKSAVSGIETPTLNVGLIGGGINTNVVPDDSGGKSGAGGKRSARADRTGRAALFRDPDEYSPHPARAAADRAARLQENGRSAEKTRRSRTRLQDRGHRCAALYRRAALFGGRHSGGALWRRPALDSRGQCAQRRRKPAAERFEGRNEDHRARRRGFAFLSCRSRESGDP